MPADQFMKIVASQELARAGAGGVSASLMSHTIGSPPIARAARPEVKARVLPQILSGQKISALAITEPSGGSDVANLRTKARRDGDHYVVSGEKTFITSGMRADYLTVAVRTGGEGAGGVSLLLIPGDTPGLSRTKLKKMGWWASDTATLHFDECRVPVENLIGEEGQGFKIIMQNFNSERIGMASSCTAFARVCVDEAIAYAKERKTFGKPIAQHQVIRHKIVDMAQRVAATPVDAGAAGLAARAGRKPGRRNLHDEEHGDANHGVLRLGSRADLRRRRLHARHQGRAHLPRGQGQRHRRRHRGDHEGSRQPADGVVTRTRLTKCSSPPTTTNRAAPCKNSSRPRSILTSMSGRRPTSSRRMSCSRSSAISASSASTSRKQFGGQGLDYSYALMMAEELGAITCGGVPMAIGVQTDMATPALARFGSDEVRREFLAPAISGDHVACIGVSEPGAGSDVASIKTQARSDGDDYVINGGKMWITNGTQADWICLLANTGDGPVHRNKSLICVPMKSKGVQIARKLDKLGMRSSDTAQIFFDNVRVPKRNRIGEEGKGFTYQMIQFQEERLWGAASCLKALEVHHRRDDRLHPQPQGLWRHHPRQPGGALQARGDADRGRAAALADLSRRRATGRRRGRHKACHHGEAEGRPARPRAHRRLPAILGRHGLHERNPVSRAYRDFRLTSIGGGADEVMLMVLCKMMGTLPGLKKGNA